MNIFEEMGFSPQEINKNEELLYNLARAYLLLSREFADFYKQFGLTPAKFNSLVLIEHLGKEKGVSQIELSERLIVSGANTTGLIDRLERDKLVVRRADPKDRRLKRIKITEKGKKLLEEVWPLHLEKANSLVQHISSDEKEAVIECLSKIKEVLKR